MTEEGRPSTSQADPPPGTASLDDERAVMPSDEDDLEQLSGSGLRMLVLGALVMVLAPLAGFLAGSIVGDSQAHRIDPLAVWLFGGLVVGGAGGIVAFLGGLRWLRANRGRL